MTDSIARHYHNLTKYDEVNVRRGRGLDWSTQPSPSKEIVSRQRVPLRPYLSFRTPGQPQPPNPQLAMSHPEVAQLSRLLFTANGVTGVIRYGHGKQQPLRAAPSAGALYPTELYVASRGIVGLDAGIYCYQPIQHELVRLWDDDALPALRAACGEATTFDDASLALVMTGVYWRSAWRYQERGYRRVLLDSGHVLANLVMAARADELSIGVHLAFVDDDVNGIFFFDEAQEGALAVLPLGGSADDDAHHDRALWRSPRVAESVDEADLLSESDLRGSATVALHRATCCTEPAPIAPAPRKTPPAPLDQEIATHIVRRRSARRYTAQDITLDQLHALLPFAFGGTSRTRDAGWLRSFLVATRVETLEPGVYEIEGSDATLQPLSLGDPTQAVHRFCLGQDIARDAAATIVFAAHPAAALEACGERAYRYLSLEAGEIGERIQVAAREHGLGACGIGGYFDDEAAALLGLAPEDWILYLVTVGVE